MHFFAIGLITWLLVAVLLPCDMGSRGHRHWAHRLEIVYWLPPAIGLLAAAVSDRDRQRRMPRPAGDRCARCGYDLTGNVSGTCPECGMPLPAADPQPPANGAAVDAKVVRRGTGD